MSKHSRRSRKKCSKSRSQSMTSSELEDVLSCQDILDGPPRFEVRNSKLMGRYMVASKNFKPGEIILKEDPLVVGPCTGCKVQCLGCYRTLENLREYSKCSGCGWFLCSQSCPGLHQKFGHEILECDLLKSSKSAKFLNSKDFDEMRTQFHAIVPLRCLILKSTQPHDYEKLMNMETHNEIRKNIPDLWQNNQNFVVDRIIKDWDLSQFDAEEIHSICGILEVNSFEIGQSGVNIRGLYPSAFLMSHDCVPNTNHSDEDKTYSLTVRSSTFIEIDQPITLSYAYTLQSTLKRREHLLENKFFHCQCRRCSDPTELGTFSGALICPKCKSGRVLAENPLDLESPWSCDNKSKTCQGYSISSKSMQLLIERITQEVDSIDCNDIKSMEILLQKYRNVLHPTHYLCLGVKLSLSQLYGKISGFLIHELSDDLLLRKKEICEEIMTVFDIIEPGYTRLRGVTLYELHAPLMVLLTREFESQCFSKSEIRSRLRKVVKCLEEAAVILGFEPITSSEGVMGLAAKDALLRIKDWEKILGPI